MAPFILLENKIQEKKHIYTIESHGIIVIVA